MKIRLNYFGQLRQITDRETQEIDVPPGTDVAGLLTLAARDHDERFGKIIFAAGGTLSASVIILANDELIARKMPPGLCDGDTLSLIPAISGG